MGQAKRRGTRDERVQQALVRLHEQRDLAVVRREQEWERQKAIGEIIRVATTK